MKLWSFIIATLILLSVVEAQPTQQPVLQSGQQTEEEKPVSIPVSEVPLRADQIYAELKKIREELIPLPAVEKIEKDLPALIDSLNSLRADPLYKNLTALSSRGLQSLRQEWEIYLTKLNHWQEILLRRIQELEERKQWLQPIIGEWEATRKQINRKQTPRAIQERISSTLRELRTVEKEIVRRMNELLIVQNKISKQQRQIEELLNNIIRAEEKLRTQIFIQDSPPLWKAIQEKEQPLHLAANARMAWGNFYRTISGFAEAHQQVMILHLLIFFVIWIIMLYFNRRNKQEKLFYEGEEVLKASAFFISRPFSAALLVALFFSIWLYPNSPEALAELMIIVLLIPFLRLMPGIVVPQRRKAVYYIALLYLILFVTNNAVSEPLVERFFLLIIDLGAMILFGWLIYLVHPVREQKLQPWPLLLFRVLPVATLALFAAVLANIIGSVNLAHVITAGIIKSVMVGVILYVIARVTDGLVILMIRKRTLRGFQFVNTYAQKVENWAVFLIHLIAFLVWVRATLKGFRLYPTFQNWFQQILAARWTIGTVVISVENIFNFLLILIFTFITTRLIRVFLDLEIFPRVKLPRGIPGAISMVTRYTVAGIGFFLAVSALGIELGKFGLLAGALGVGLGFGLQNIIANFVSGLILAFERPIQVGDKVEVGNVLGFVKQIGVRSSTIKTFDGSEVIVPNADLISQQVTNWTLSDRRQRMTLPVKVAFDSDPEKVLEILLQVAREHPGVLKNPEPIATFNGFGDYFLDFTLYYWVSDNILQIKTEVAMKVYHKLQEAGIEKPRPQQDLFLKHLEEKETKRKKTAGKNKPQKLSEE